MAIASKLLVVKNRVIKCVFLLFIYSLSGLVQVQAAADLDPVEAGKDKLYRILVGNNGLTKDQNISDYVNEIADKIVIASKIPSTYKRTLVVNSPEIIALTNYHYVFISTGLIALLSDEAELAAIISHEVAHITSDHQAKTREVVDRLLEYQEKYEEDGYDSFTNDLSRTYVLLEIQRNRRQFEAAADKAALNYLFSGNYNPYAYVAALKKIELTIDNSFALKNEQNRIISELLSTHPSMASRVKNVNQILDSYKAYTLTYRNYAERFINNTNGMTLYVEQSRGIPEKYILRYVRKTSLKQLKQDEDFLEYILLINQVDNADGLENKDRIKRVYREK